MKLAKLSLAAILAVGTSAFAADTLADAFKEGKVSGTLKAYYMDNSNGGTTADTDAFATGGVLKFQTAPLNGLMAGFEFQTSHTMGMDDDNAALNDTTVAIQESMLSEAYLAYTMDKTTVKVGRQHIGLPLLSDSGSRLLRDFFTGATVVSSAVENVTLVGGVVTHWTSRNNVQTNFEDPIYTVYAAGSFGPVAVSAQYVTINEKTAGGNDGRDDFYLDAEFTTGGDMPVTVGAQYIGVDDEAGNYDSYSVGLKAELAVAGFNFGAYYTTTDDEGNVPGGWGHGDDPSYNSIQKLSGKGAGVDAYQGRVGYDFSKAGIAGLTAFTRYAQYDDYDGAGLDADEWDIDATYAFSGALKGLTAQIRYAMVDRDGADNDTDNFRFIANYNF